jgi:hypothetical protein
MFADLATSSFATQTNEDVDGRSGIRGQKAGQLTVAGLNCCTRLDYI